jgi:glycosyltransferase involved in cell wall biosynthesis
MHISVCICTYQRPQLLKRLLDALRKQETRGEFSYSVVIADNDAAESGRAAVQETETAFPVSVTYCTDPRRSIAHARNKALEHAEGDAIAFIDDDEFPEKDWLFRLHETLAANQVAGVLGPVRPHFDNPPPSWVLRGRFCERPEHPTGFQMPWSECRTGNVLFRREIIKGLNPVFLPEFGTAGSDVNFFWRMMQRGNRFIWCNEAVVHEVVPPSRWKRSFLLKRALLRGGNFLKHPEGRWSSLAKSAVAVPVYTLMLPFLQLAGHHLFMKYLIKWCDHSARLLSLLGVKLIRQRQM